MSHPVLDTNVLVRLFTAEPKKQAEAVAAFFQRLERENGVVELPSLIVAETVYVLQSFYKAPKGQIVSGLSHLIQLPQIAMTEKAVVIKALQLYDAGTLGFQDAYVAAKALANNAPVVSFDKGFDKIKHLTRLEPAAS